MQSKQIQGKIDFSFYTHTYVDWGDNNNDYKYNVILFIIEIYLS